MRTERRPHEPAQQPDSDNTRPERPSFRRDRASRLPDRRDSPASILRTAGRRHGPIVRLVSPSDIGELIKPFVFLDHAEVPFTGRKLTGIHPHSGIATLTTVLRGGLAYEDTTGKRGEVPTGGLEWMKAGGACGTTVVRSKATRCACSNSGSRCRRRRSTRQPESQYIAPDEVEADGPVRVILGRHGRARSGSAHRTASTTSTFA